MLDEQVDTASFLFSDEEEDFREVVRGFAAGYADSYLPQSKSEEFVWGAHRDLAASGLLNLRAPEKWGGQEVSRTILGIAVEELAYANQYLAQSAFLINNFSTLLAEYGSEEMQQEWFPKILNGEALVSLALTEPEAGSDAANIRTRAEKVDGGWVLKD